MEPITWTLLATPLAAMGLTAFRRNASNAVEPRVAKLKPQPAALPQAKPMKAPKLDDFSWDGPIATRAPTGGQAPVPASAELVLRRKIRDRYIAARFPCTAQSSADLENAERMIKAARLFFEELQPDRAMELLSLAIEQCPEVESLRLAQLEIAFLMRDGKTFAALALEHRRIHPASKDWEQVARLGRTVAPQEPAFGLPGGAPVNAHYGPWPDTPNWIHASWDLTGEVLAYDFHVAMKQA